MSKRKFMEIYEEDILPGLEEEATPKEEPATYGLEDAMADENLQMELIEDVREIDEIYYGFEKATSYIDNTEKVIRTEEGLQGTIDTNTVLYSIEHAREVASILGFTEEELPNIGIESIPDNTRLSLFYSVEAKGDMLKKAMDAIIKGFEKLWTIVKKATAKVATLMIGLDKKYKIVMSRLDNKDSKAKDGEPGQLLNAEKKDIYLRLPIIFTKDTTKFDDSTAINEVQKLVNMVLKNHLAVEKTITNVAVGVKDAIAAIKSNKDDMDMQLKTAASKVISGGVLASAEVKAISEYIFPDEPVSDIISFTQVHGKTIKYLRRGYILRTKEEGGAIKVSDGPVSTADAVNIVKDKDVIFASTIMEYKTITPNTELDEAKIASKIELLSLEKTRELLRTVSVMGVNFKTYYDKANAPSEKFGKLVKDEGKNLIAAMNVVDMSNVKFKSFATATEAGIKRTFANGSSVTPKLTLDNVMGYFGLFNAVVKIADVIGTKYPEKPAR